MTLKEKFSELNCPKILNSVQIAEFDATYNNKIKEYINSSRFLIDTQVCVEVFIEGIKSNLGLEDFILSFKEVENGEIFITIDAAQSIS